MPYITTSDGTEIYYTEQGTGRPVLLSHGWPLSSDAWQPELKLFGKVVKYAAQYGRGRVAKVVTAGAVPPIMLQSEANREGTPIEVFDDLRAQVLNDRSAFWKELAVPFYGFNREGAPVSQGLIDDAARKAIELVKHGILKVYPGASHGIYGAYQQQLVRDILDFTKD